MGVFLALGANQPAVLDNQVWQPEQSFALAVKSLKICGIDTVSTSSLWQSPAWPDPQAQPPYINGVIKVETLCSPTDLLAHLKAIEIAFGRQDRGRNAPRPLDLDILDMQGVILQTADLTLPHPRMLERAFVLFPLREIAPNWVDPKRNRAILDWIARLESVDIEGLKRLKPFLPPLIS